VIFLAYFWNRIIIFAFLITGGLCACVDTEVTSYSGMSASFADEMENIAYNCCVKTNTISEEKLCIRKAWDKLWKVAHNYIFASAGTILSYNICAIDYIAGIVSDRPYLVFNPKTNCAPADIITVEIIGGDLKENELKNIPY